MIASRCNWSTVDEWRKKLLLEDLFTLGTKAPVALGHTGAWYVFEHIYCPIRLPTAAGMPDAWTYYDIGFKFTDLSEMFWAKYSGNYFEERFENQAAFLRAGANNESRVLSKFIAVVRKNFDKYMRLMELQGYTYNPLFNVDGVESYASADVHGDETTTSKFNDTRTHTVSTYDGQLKDEYADTTASPAAGDTVEKSHTGTGLGAAAYDNPFGEAVSSADTYHVDKRVRQGNIGVTKSQELVAAQREVLRSSIIEEFFDDLERSLIIPLY